MSTLPSEKTPLNQHSLREIESWLFDLGAEKCLEDPCLWRWTSSKGLAKIYGASLKALGINVTTSLPHEDGKSSYKSDVNDFGGTSECIAEQCDIFEYHNNMGDTLIGHPNNHAWKSWYDKFLKPHLIKIGMIK